MIKSLKLVAVAAVLFMAASVSADLFDDELADMGVGSEECRNWCSTAGSVADLKSQSKNSCIHARYSKPAPHVFNACKMGAESINAFREGCLVGCDMPSMCNAGAIANEASVRLRAETACSSVKSRKPSTKPFDFCVRGFISSATDACKQAAVKFPQAEPLEVLHEDSFAFDELDTPIVTHGDPEPTRKIRGAKTLTVDEEAAALAARAAAEAEAAQKAAAAAEAAAAAKAAADKVAAEEKAAAERAAAQAAAEKKAAADKAAAEEKAAAERAAAEKAAADIAAAESAAAEEKAAAEAAAAERATAAEAIAAQKAAAAAKSEAAARAAAAKKAAAEAALKAAEEAAAAEAALAEAAEAEAALAAASQAETDASGEKRKVKLTAASVRK